MGTEVKQCLPGSTLAAILSLPSYTTPNEPFPSTLSFSMSCDLTIKGPRLPRGGSGAREPDILTEKSTWSFFPREESTKEKASMVRHRVTCPKNAHAYLRHQGSQFHETVGTLSMVKFRPQVHSVETKKWPMHI